MTARAGVPQRDVDVAVIGAGVIGLAVAAALSGRCSVAVLERRPSYGRENSSHNSGVIHAGIYYAPGWLKTSLCVEGNRLLYAWADEHAVRVRRLGKLVVAFDEGEVAALERLAQAAAANGVPELRMMGGHEVRSLEPAVSAVRALYSGTSGVVDQMGLMRSYVDVARAGGAHFAFQHTVNEIRRSGGGFVVAGAGPDNGTFQIAAGAVVNAAGLGADRIGALARYHPDGGPGHPAFRQYVNKGRYYDIVDGRKAAGISHLVYPLPHEGREGLGVHLTLDIDGGLHLGPDAEWLDEGAALDFRAADDRREAFLNAARRYLPQLEADDLQPGQVGYRPKLSGPGQPARDFLVFADRGYVHLGGIESPGLTASLAMARRVAALLPSSAFPEANIS